MSMSKINIFVCISIVICSLSSCIPIGHTRVLAVFKNCTNYTVYIGASHYDNIDSVSEQVSPHYNFVANNGLDISDISLWKGTFFRSDNFIYPDSLCSIDADYLFHDTDTCYFFLIKWENAKGFSWDEIRAKKLFRRWIVTRDKEGWFDRHIRNLNTNKN